MKDQYVGDISDYLKYALLRSLRSEGERTAIVWMLTRGDSRTDGRRLGYLGRPELFRPIDPPLFDALHFLVNSEGRSVKGIQAGGVLPRASFFDGELGDSLTERSSYMGHVLATARASQLLFFDPDNGIDVQSVPKGRRNSSKYVYRDEILEAYERGASVTVYQHFPRRARAPFLRDLADDLLALTNCGAVLTLVTGHVAFLVLPQPRDESALRTSMQTLDQRTRSLGARFLHLT